MRFGPQKLTHTKSTILTVLVSGLAGAILCYVWLSLAPSHRVSTVRVPSFSAQASTALLARDTKLQGAV